MVTVDYSKQIRTIVIPVRPCSCGGLTYGIFIFYDTYECKTCGAWYASNKTITHPKALVFRIFGLK